MIRCGTCRHTGKLTINNGTRCIFASEVNRCSNYFATHRDCFTSLIVFNNSGTTLLDLGDIFINGIDIPINACNSRSIVSYTTVKLLKCTLYTNHINFITIAVIQLIGRGSYRTVIINFSTATQQTNSCVQLRYIHRISSSSTRSNTTQSTVDCVTCCAIFTGKINNRTVGVSAYRNVACYDILLYKANRAAIQLGLQIINN